MRIVRLAFLAGPAILAFAVLGAFVAPTNAETLLYQDNFATSHTLSYDVNVDLGTPRQSGSLVPVGGVDYTQNHNGSGQNSSGAGQYLIGHPDYPGRLLTWTGANVTPNLDFNGANSAGGLNIEYDLATDTFYRNIWSSFSVGQAAAPVDGVDVYTSTFTNVSLLVGYIDGPKHMATLCQRHPG